jgi:hypothetical protein
MSKWGQYHQGLKIPQDDDGFTVDNLKARIDLLSHNKGIVIANINMMRQMQRKYPKLDYSQEIATELRRVKGLEAHIKYVKKQLDEEEANIKK